MEISGEQLHNWYLEAVEHIRPDSYNPNAIRPYKDLSLKQQEIDNFIARKLNIFYSKECDCNKELSSINLTL